jgi:hypothetical protein
MTLRRPLRVGLIAREANVAFNKRQLLRHRVERSKASGDAENRRLAFEASASGMWNIA